MLTVSQKIAFTGESKIDGKVMERFTCQIDIENPENIVYNRFIIDKDGFRDNRDECLKDQEEFESVIYAAQAQMESEDGKVSDPGIVENEDAEEVEEATDEAVEDEIPEEPEEGNVDAEDEA